MVAWMLVYALLGLDIPQRPVVERPYSFFGGVGLEPAWDLKPLPQKPKRPASDEDYTSLRPGYLVVATTGIEVQQVFVLDTYILPDYKLILYDRQHAEKQIHAEITRNADLQQSSLSELATEVLLAQPKWQRRRKAPARGAGSPDSGARREPVPLPGPTPNSPDGSGLVHGDRRGGLAPAGHVDSPSPQSPGPEPVRDEAVPQETAQPLPQRLR
jgi:hypothetical protein